MTGRKAYMKIKPLLIHLIKNKGVCYAISTPNCKDCVYDDKLSTYSCKLSCGVNGFDCYDEWVINKYENAIKEYLRIYGKDELFEVLL